VGLILLVLLMDLIGRTGREWNVESKLAEKVTEDQAEGEEEERRRMGKRWTEEDDGADAKDDGISEESEDDEIVSKAAKLCRQGLFYWKNSYNITLVMTHGGIGGHAECV
jgi:hypothetical protein